MSMRWVSVAACIWCNVFLGAAFCASLILSTVALEAQNNLGHERLRLKITSQTTGNDYSEFITLLRDYVISGSLSNGIPQLREPTLPVSDPQRFVLVELTNNEGGHDTVTVAIDVVNLYVVGYEAGGESFFLHDAIDGASQHLFTGTNQINLQYGGNYGDLERIAGESRDKISLGREDLISAVTALRGSRQERARSLIVVTQMISEAARFNPIFWRVREHIESGSSFVPDMYMLQLESSWRLQSTLVQQSTQGVFNTPIRLQVAAPCDFIPLGNVRDVVASLALMLFVCSRDRQSSSSHHEQYYPSNYSPLLIMRPVVAENINYTVVNDDANVDANTCPIWEPTVRIAGRHGLCVDVSNGQFRSGFPVNLRPCKSNDDANQLWTIKRDRTLRSNGMCMTARNGFRPGQHIMISHCNAAVTVEAVWEIRDDGTIINPTSGLVLTAEPVSSGFLSVQPNTYLLRQNWLASFDTTPREVTIFGFHHLCLEGNLINVWLEKCASSKQQQRWALYGDGSIRPKQNQDRCLNTGNDFSGTAVNVVVCSAGTSRQRWVFTNESTILNLNNRMVMEVRQSNPAHRQIILSPFIGNPNQKWLPVP